MLFVNGKYEPLGQPAKQRSAIAFTFFLIMSSHAAMQFGIWEAKATTDQDGDGLPYGIEFLINTQPQDWDSDNDGLPDGWEWQYGLDPLSASGDNGSTGDPDSDGLTNLNEYLYGIPTGWDEPSTTNVLDNGVWWNGTVPVRNWDEESAMQVIQGAGTDGADEDPVGNICTDTFDNDHDGMVDSNDDDNDGDADCSSDDDDGDGLIDEDPNGWDTDGDGMPDGWEAAHGLDPTSNSNQDGTYGDPDSDGLANIYEYVNPAWGTRNGSTFPPTQYFRPGPINMTITESPCNPILSLGPGGCQIFTAEVDGITQTDPMNNDTDGDNLNDSFEALVLLTDPTSPDTDSDGIWDGIEYNGSYGNPAQGSDPRNNNTDGDYLDDGEEDLNGNGVIDENETDPTRVNDEGDFDGDGIQNWQENMSCTLWNVSDTDGGGVSDGDEKIPWHGTDPCTSLSELEFTIIEWDENTGALELNSTNNLNPNPVDWRNMAPLAYYESANGSRTPFSFTSIDVNLLRGVDTPLPAGVNKVVFTNGSWCWNATAGAINDPYCDDDYFDSDGDGLADWEETFGVWGYISLANLPDSDGDGVDDLSEIQNDTDPLEPCHNLLDSDGDGLNNYFENTTGCEMRYGIQGGNLTFDIWLTLWNEPDSDNGGVDDGQEYIDGTNPQDNPDDDINPLDTDGDGIPDSVELEIGTDWRDPDTDGGGVPDGEECPQEFWLLDCVGAPSNPFDPNDDLNENALMFTAVNTTIGMDPGITHYWRWHTYDYYTGVSWGVNSTLVGYTPIVDDWSTDQGVADQAFWNHSSPLSWEITFDEAGYISPGRELIQPYNVQNFTTWVDFSAGLNFSNYTRDVMVDGSTIESLYVNAPEVILSAEVRENTTAFTGAEYGLDLPEEFLLSTEGDEVSRITQDVLNQSGALSAWDKISAIQDFLVNGNETITFLRNYDGSGRTDGLGSDSDVSYWILNSSHEGSCDEFASLFAVMLRLSGIPTRKVTGFSGGTWDGKSISVYGKDFTTWVEAHLQTNQNQGDLDVGWVPFEACPSLSPIEVVNEDWGPTWVERNTTLSDQIWLDGTLIYSGNSTAVDNLSISMYLVSTEDSENVPGSAAISDYLVATAITDENGSFNLTGLPPSVIRPGFASLVIQTSQRAYVGTQGISFPWQLNISDDVSISISEPTPVGEPMLGIGVNSTIIGQISWASEPNLDPSLVDDMQVVLNYTSAVDGVVSISSSVSGGGFFEFTVPIDETEPLGPINATISFDGWHSTDLNNVTPPSYHARPGNLELVFNITLSPNLTVSLESQGSNNTVLEIGSNIYLNGTVLSRGEAPTTLNGTLILEMRRSDISGPYLQLESWYLNDSSWGSSPGNFSIVWPFSPEDVPIPAGVVDVRIQFDADNLNANDQKQFIDGEFGIRSIVQFTYALSPEPRGIEANVEVLLTDHTGLSFASFQGEYNLDFDGSWAWSEIDPSSARLGVSWTPAVDLDPGDYPWVLSYNGSTWMAPNSSSDTIRIQGLANATASFGSDWTPRGGTNWVSGTARDLVLNSPVTGNNSSVSVLLQVPSDLPSTPDGFPAGPDSYTLATGWIDPINGEYNMTFSIPSGIPSGSYQVLVRLDFNSNPLPGGSYYKTNDPTSVLSGVQTEFVLETTPSELILIAGEQLILSTVVTDVEDPSEFIGGVSLDLYFDWGGPQQQILQSTTSDSTGTANFNPVIPSSIAPGFYDVRIHAPDDLVDNLSTPNAGRWVGNDSITNLTVQVGSLVDIESIPAQVTALQYFTIEGTVLDSVDSNRSVDGPVGINVFFLDEPEEILIENYTTNSNGSFNVSVPTDTLGNGVIRGDRTVVVSVVNGSTPFYLTGTGDASILVIGVPWFQDSTPFLNTIVDRGETATMTARLVEFSNNDAPLSGFTVLAKFHDTWLDPQVTASDGSVSFDFDIPHDHPLGLVNVTLLFNGSVDLHPTIDVLNTITVRSTASMTIDPIMDNPMAGDFFNITGNLVSSNGSALIDRVGNTLNPTLTFTIDGDSDTFVVTQVSFLTDGSWNAEVRLDLTFPRGVHAISAVYTPDVTYFTSASSLATFDSRGYSQLSIVSPSDLDPDSRTIRGDSFELNLSIVDNAGDPVPSATLVVEIDGVTVWGGLSNLQGEVSASILARPDRDPGPMLVNVSFSGINGTTGLVGDESWTRVVVLAPTVISIIGATQPSIAGESITFTGKLVDELGQILLDDGEQSGGLVHLSIDGIDSGPAYASVSNWTTGQWTIEYQIPMDMDFGPHSATFDFLGGFSWVDPMGQGDSINPEFYLDSTASMMFNVTQTSQVIISTPPSEVDRAEVALVEGILTDGIGRNIPDRELSVSVDGQILTVVNSDINGSFNALIPIPPNMPLGPVIIEVEFLGEEFILPSNSSTILTVFGPVFIGLDEPEPVAVGDILRITGTVKDNLDDGWLGNHTIEVFVDGFLVGITSSSDDGTWSLNWEVPETVDVGNHSMSIVAPSQGFHRQGSSEAIFTVSYHTSVSLSIEEHYATRGEQWNFSGRLFESDTGFELGMDGRTISVLLDGSVVGEVTTEVGGLFSYSLNIPFSMSRGEHNVSFAYGGEFLYLPSESNIAVFALSDISIELQPISNSIIRGSTFPSENIMIQGLVREIGGESSIFENLTLKLTWGGSNLPMTDGPWDNPNTLNFQIRAKAQEYMPPGLNTVTIDIEQDQSRFINGITIDVEILVMVEVDFVLSGLELSQGQRVIRGTVNATATDTGEPLEGLSMTAILLNGSTSHFAMTRLTDSQGVFEYEFKSLSPLPPLSDTSSWGVLTVLLGSDSEFVDPGSLTLLPSGGVQIQYEKNPESSFFGSLTFLATIILSIAALVAIGIVVVSQRKKAAIKELAGIFSQTAEMLASGDEYRRAIFECYESLCTVLTRRGFLRRNFETVREFENAIRLALPIREESLVALDRIFEEARYSSHVMGDSHRENAQLALSSVIQDIEELQEIPIRTLQEAEV